MAVHVMIACQMPLSPANFLKPCQICLQEVQKLDLGANASSGTSNEEDGGQADDGDDWSDEQTAALQVPLS